MSLLERSEPIFGCDGIKKLSESSVIVFGAGGVGCACIEALARCGIGRLCIVDNDTVSDSNRNRQLIALSSNLGKSKAREAAARVAAINPNCAVEATELFYSAENSDIIDLSSYDYVADCIDTVTSKLLLIKTAKEQGVPVISAMGTGNRINPTKIKVTDVFSTSNDALARVMRRELRTRGITELTVVCSDEEPAQVCEGRNENGRATPSSTCFVPIAAGLTMAYEIVKEILKCQR